MSITLNSPRQLLQRYHDGHQLGLSGHLRVHTAEGSFSEGRAGWDRTGSFSEGRVEWDGGGRAGQGTTPEDLARLLCSITLHTCASPFPPLRLPRPGGIHLIAMHTHHQPPTFTPSSFEPPRSGRFSNFSPPPPYLRGQVQLLQHHSDHTVLNTPDGGWRAREGKRHNV